MMSNQRQPPNVLLVAHELGLALLNRDDDDEEDIDLTHFQKAMAEIIKVFPLLGRVFVPISNDIANANNDLLRLQTTGSHADKFKYCLSMIQYETKTNVINDEETETGIGIVNTLNRIMKFLVLLIGELSSSEPVTRMAPIARRLYDQILAPASKWHERQMARLAIRTLPKQAQLMKRLNGGADSPSFNIALTQIVMYGRRVCERIEKMTTRWNVQNVTM